MPYWASSRVGIQPQPEAKSSKNVGNNKSSRSERFSSRQKGITMEDLKKQTALRLAEEQNRQRGGGRRGQHRHHQHTQAGPPQQTNNNPQPATRSAAPPSVSTQQPPSQTSHHDVRVGVDVYNVERGSSCGQQQQQRTGPPPPSVNPYLSSSTAAAAPLYHNHAIHNSSHPTHVHVSSNNSALSNSASFSISETASTVSSSSAGTHHSHNNNNNNKQTANNNSSNNNKSKLPHGLTVQELKEMTKARLQAEAASSQPKPTAAGQAAQQETAVPPPPAQLNRPSSRGAPSPHSFSQQQQEWQEPRSEPVQDRWDATGLAAPSTSDYNSALPEYGPNRRRAVTLSPRFGTFFEDQEYAPPPPSIPDAPALRERALSSDQSRISQAGGMALPPLRPRAFSSEPSSATSLYHAPPTTTLAPSSSAGVVGSGNRVRTSSAASLPPMAFGSVSEDAPLTGGETAAATASSYLSDVFRSTLFDSSVSAATEPLAAVDNDLVASSSNASGSSPRIRAATWSEPLFGPCDVGGAAVDALPYTELASILKLSGASEGGGTGEKEDDPNAL